MLFYPGRWRRFEGLALAFAQHPQDSASVSKYQSLVFGGGRTLNQHPCVGHHCRIHCTCFGFYCTSKLCFQNLTAGFCLFSARSLRSNVSSTTLSGLLMRSASARFRESNILECTSSFLDLCFRQL